MRIWRPKHSFRRARPDAMRGIMDVIPSFVLQDECLNTDSRGPKTIWRVPYGEYLREGYLMVEGENTLLYCSDDWNVYEGDE